MVEAKGREVARERRHGRVRKKVFGTPERPRLSVFRSTKHIYAQIIEDVSQRTLVSAASVEPSIKALLDATAGQEVARQVGKILGQRALEKGIEKVAFDRGGYLYHGRVKALAEGAREAGLDF